MQRDDPTAVSLRRIQVAVAGLGVVIGLGTLGYLVLPVAADGARFGVLDALYQTVTTVTTVGFRELKPFGDREKLFTLAIVLTGVSSALYTLTLVMQSVVVQPKSSVTV